MSSTRGLNPVYTALDSRQYTRAVKLCQGLDPSNTLGRALLAHAYAKSGQRFKALTTLQGIFEDDCFPELQLAIKYECTPADQQEQAAKKKPESNASPKKQTTKKLTKKGKKKTGAVSAAASVSAATTDSLVLPTLEEWDLIDRLDTPPTLPEDWETRLPISTSALEPEPTLVDTLAMVMATQLRLPLTVYQLYCWAIAFPKTKRDHVEDLHNAKKLYQYGLAILLHPRYNSITPTILSNLQTRALQIAKLQQHLPLEDQVPATLWAAQTALWRLQFAPDDDDSQSNNTSLLPRLAESLALKSYEMAMSAETNPTPTTSLVATESFLLYLRALERQGKWQDMWEALATKTTDPQAEWLRGQTLHVLQHVEEGQGSDDTLLTLLESLLRQYPDDWEYWQLYEKAARKNENTREKVHQLIQEILERKEPYSLRAPRLFKVELAAAANNSSNELVETLTEYGNEMASRAASAFKDLEGYFDKLSVQDAATMLDWAESLLQSASHNMSAATHTPKERQKQLKQYIFAVQVNFKIVSLFTEEFKDRLPGWRPLIEVWDDYRKFEEEAELHQAQKEQRPPDELVLLATQRILFGSQDLTKDRVLAATLLEAAIQYSPDNAYLKIAAIFVYADLDAPSRSHQLYNELYIKHVQNESCSYVIIPLLRSGGLFSEALGVCHSIQNFQRIAHKETVEGIVKAIEHGAMTKAEEFIVFQREKMKASLTAVEAKSLILDLAPLIGGVDNGFIGGVQGLIGGDDDQERVEQMAIEAHNPAGPFGLFQENTSDVSRFCDNRDLSIVGNEILGRREFDSSAEILHDCNLRRHQHGLLVRLALCLSAADGPKKGKVSKLSPIAGRRCKGLLSAIKAAEDCLAQEPESIHAALLRTTVAMCHFVITLVGGYDRQGAISLNDLLAREQQACQDLADAKLAIGTVQKQDGSTLGCCSRLLHECITPLFSCFLMCAKLSELYGWGRRKRKTKPCAGAVAELAAAIALVTTGLQRCCDRSSVDDALLQEVRKFVEEIVQNSVTDETVATIQAGQEKSTVGLSSFYHHISQQLDKFHCED